MTTITLAPYDPAWPSVFAQVGEVLRAELEPLLGDRLTAVHHIGSTSVPGLAAKPIIDVQVSIRDFRPWTRTDLPVPDGKAENPSRENIGEDPALIDAFASAGLEWLGDWNFDRRKWFFLRRDDLAVNCHVRREGCASQQQALLFRDYLRAKPEVRERYEEVKRGLAEHEWTSVDAYSDAKGDCVWGALREADGWAMAPGWRPGPTEA